MSDAVPTIAVLGGGPIGLEAAVAAAQRGYRVRLYERGSIAENVRDWGHVRLFSPFGLNTSKRGRELLSDRELPGEDLFLTGDEFVTAYLQPLAETPLLSGCIETGVSVLGVSRERALKGEHVGHSARNASPFCLLMSDGNREFYQTADVVIDCTGTWGNSLYAGPGGLPAIGERELLTPLNYRLPNLDGAERERFAGRKTLVVGSGYSAATAVRDLARLHRKVGTTRALWITRTNRTPPLSVIESDVLSERQALISEVNALAESGQGGLEWRPETALRQIDPGESGYRVHLESGLGANTESSIEAVDELLILTGARPDTQLHRELQIHECYASEGPMKLATSLMSESASDCMTQPAPEASVLLNPEMGYFIVGSKSYGRNSHFLLRIGLEQIDQVLQVIDSLPQFASAVTTKEHR